MGRVSAPTAEVTVSGQASGLFGHRKLYKALRHNYHMVAKIVSGAYADGRTDIDLPRLLYTGTGKNYLRDTLRERREFAHKSEKYVHLTEGPVTAMSYAAQRASFYRDSPVVLVVDTHKLIEDLHYHGGYETRALNVGSFLPYEFTIDEDGKFGREEWLGIGRIEDTVIQSSEEDVRREVGKFLSSAC